MTMYYEVEVNNRTKYFKTKEACDKWYNTQIEKYGTKNVSAYECHPNNGSALPTRFSDNEI